MPIELDDAGKTARIDIDVAGDVAAAAARGSLAEATLRMLVVNLTAQDEVEYHLNDTVLDIRAATSRILYNDLWYEFALAPEWLRQGWNSLSLTVGRRNPWVAAPLTVESVELIIRYRCEHSEVHRLAASCTP